MKREEDIFASLSRVGIGPFRSEKRPCRLLKQLITTHNCVSVWQQSLVAIVIITAIEEQQVRIERKKETDVVEPNQELFMHKLNQNWSV